MIIVVDDATYLKMLQKNCTHLMSLEPPPIPVIRQRYVCYQWDYYNVDEDDRRRWHSSLVVSWRGGMMIGGGSCEIVKWKFSTAKPSFL